MLSALKAGVVTIGSKPGKPGVRYAVSAGYLRIDAAGAVEILVEQALPATEIDRDAAEREKAAAEAELARWGNRELDAEHVNLQQRAAWAQARLTPSRSSATRTERAHLPRAS